MNQESITSLLVHPRPRDNSLRRFIGGSFPPAPRFLVPTAITCPCHISLFPSVFRVRGTSWGCLYQSTRQGSERWQGDQSVPRESSAVRFEFALLIGSSNPWVPVQGHKSPGWSVYHRNNKTPTPEKDKKII